MPKGSQQELYIGLAQGYLLAVSYGQETVTLDISWIEEMLAHLDPYNTAHTPEPAPPDDRTPEEIEKLFADNG